MSLIAKTRQLLLGPTRLIWLAAILIIATIGVITGTLRWKEYQRIDQDERSMLAFRATLAEKEIFGLIRGINVALDEVATELGNNSPRLDTLLVHYKSFFPEVQSFMVLDARGVVRYATLSNWIGADRSGMDYVDVALTRPDVRKLIIGKPGRDIQGIDIMPIAKAVPDKTGATKWIVLARIDLRYFDDVLRSLTNNEDQSAFIVHEGGRIAARYPDGDQFRYSDLTKGQSFFIRHLASRERLTTHLLSSAIDNKMKYVATVDVIPGTLITSSRLIAGIAENQDRVFAVWRANTVLYLLSWLVVTGLVLWMSWLIARRQQELILSRNEAIQASKAKSQFLSSMSHELRTPLNAILGFSQITEMTTKENDTRESVKQIISSGWHLLDLINDVLDLAKIEASQMKLSVEAVQLPVLLHECSELMLPLAKDRDMTLKLELGGDVVDCFVNADRIRLKQSVLNLLSNAVKYGRERGLVRLVAALRNGKIRVEVIDDGAGIPAEKLKQMFTPFNRLGFEGSNILGAGLGLSLTKQMVALMGGTTGVESTPGKGSTFWIELPATTAPTALTDAVQLAPRPASTPEAGATVRALCVEDNPSNAQMILGIMELLRPNIEITLATDGKTGLEHAEKINPDLLLLDIQLPDMDGIELLGRLRALGINAPALALTAAAMPDDVARGKNAGFHDYLTKPLDVARLVAAVDKALEAGNSGQPASTAQTLPATGAPA
jgi:hypothetical protein